MRGLAALALALAGFDWLPPFIDRPGLVALGLAFAALAIPAGPRRLPWQGERARGPALFDGLPLDDLDPGDLAARIEAATRNPIP